MMKLKEPAGKETSEETQCQFPKLTPSTPSYAHVVLPCAYDSPTLITFFYANARGLPECTELRQRSGEDGVNYAES
jgi:hypothetical protein